jgi:membrane protease YdiL (CAAX protease family)
MRHLAILLRSILGGFLVSSLGIALWSAALAFIPAPWSILPMIPVLWLFWRFFSGRPGPGPGSRYRREQFRLTRLTARAWVWGLAGALVFVVIVQSSFVLTFRILPFPGAAFTKEYPILDQVPVWVAWALLVMSSIVAGVSEEIGFRGYMQLPLEKQYGPVVAIAVTSLLFMLIHLNHSWARPIWPQIVFASILLGILAWRTKSLIPGIIGHSILDIFDYSVWWSDLTGGFRQLPISRVGVDVHFVLWVFIFVAALVTFGIAMGKLKSD